jgi:flagellar biosynthesis/type III secretory pathway chaperone
MKDNASRNHPSNSMPFELFENLDRQVDLSQQLVDILGQELNALTAMDIQTLLTLTRKKENQLKRLQLLDAAFQEIARTILAASSPEPVRLREVIGLAGQEEAARLEQSRIRLVALRHKIHDRNLINKQLAHDVLGYLNDAVSLITNAATNQVPYSAKGSSQPAARQPTLISREI